MQESQRGQPTKATEPAVPLADVLICRIVDGESTGADRDRFESIATDEPLLWRELALRQRDAALLVERVQDVIESVDRIDLHTAAAQPHRWIGRAAAYGGWAAVVALMVIWSVRTLAVDESPMREMATPVVTDGSRALTADDHFEAYLRAPFVVGELDPILLDTFPQPDGSTEIRFLRRIEEKAFLAPAEEIPADGDSTLTVDPSELRD